MIKLKFSYLLTLILALMLSSRTSNAADCIWVGGVEDWDDPLNWDCGVVPGVGDKAIIPSGTVFLDIIGGIIVDDLELIDGEIATGTTSDLIVTKSMAWKGGVILCALVIDDGAILDISTAASKTIGPTGMLTISGLGLAAWTDGVLTLDGPLFNMGTFMIEFDGAVMGGGLLDNAGTLVKTMGIGDVEIFVEVLNTGVIEVKAGTIGLDAPFTNTGDLLVEPGMTLGMFSKTALDPGTDILSTGSLVFCGDTANFNTALSFMAAMEFCGGVVMGINDIVVTSGPISFTSGKIIGLGTLFAAGMMTWEEGEIDTMASVAIEPSGDLSISTAGPKILHGTLGIAGITTLTSTATFEINGPGKIDNMGTLNLEGGVDITSTGLTGSITNAGTLVKKSSLTSSLSLDLASSGTISGIGSIAVLGIFINTGIVAPGSSPGTLDFASSFSNGTQLDMEIEDGSGPGIGHDLLTATGSIALKDTLKLVETGIVPLGVYTIISCGGGPGCISGTFVKTDLPADYTITYGSETVTVTKSAPAPVEMLFFKGRAMEESVMLEWATATETNNAAFLIERSYDAYNFESLGTINGAGNSWTQQNYSYLDKKINPALVRNILYYRLLQMDHDGTIDYSPVIAIPFERIDKKWSIKLIPTTSPQMVRLFFQNLVDKEVRVSVFDVNGKVYQQKNIRLGATAEELEIDLSGLGSGWYFIQSAIGRNFQQTEKWWIAK